MVILVRYMVVCMDIVVYTARRPSVADETEHSRLTCTWFVPSKFFVGSFPSVSGSLRHLASIYKYTFSII